MDSTRKRIHSIALFMRVNHNWKTASLRQATDPVSPVLKGADVTVSDSRLRASPNISVEVVEPDLVEVHELGAIRREFGCFTSLLPEPGVPVTLGQIKVKMPSEVAKAKVRPSGDQARSCTSPRSDAISLGFVPR